MIPASSPTGHAGFRLALEITRRCPLVCPKLCYAQAGPALGPGTMTIRDWTSVIAEAATLGVSEIQLIGGEPTTSRAFPILLDHALGRGMRVEIYTNLFNIKRTWWDELFNRPGVSLATSYHSDDPAEHDRITGRTGSHARTRANIAEAVARRVPIRVGIIHTLDRQRVAEAESDLRTLGVQRIGIDRVRAIGNAAAGNTSHDTGQLCGRCGRGRAAISPDGEVWPCVLGRWLTAGNVRTQGLAAVLAGPRWRHICAQIPASNAICNPECKPSTGDGSDCAPAETETCGPSFCTPDD